MATVKTVTVSYERKISDGNYGTESAGAFVVTELSEGETALSTHQAKLAAQYAREGVYATRCGSGESRVRMQAQREASGLAATGAAGGDVPF